MARRQHRLRLLLLPAAVAGAVLVCAAALAGVAALSYSGCASPSVDTSAGLLPPGQGITVTASDYGGPNDATVHNDHGAFGTLGDKNAFAELSNNWWLSNASGCPGCDYAALGGLPPGTLLRITYNGHSVIAAKLDVGAGGPGVGGTKRAIDLWYPTAQRLGFSGLHLVKIERVSGSAVNAALQGAGSVVNQAAALIGQDCSGDSGAGVGHCVGGAYSGPTVPGDTAKLNPDGTATPPDQAPDIVKCMIEAANEIHTTPYPSPDQHYGTLMKPWPAYDCSGSTSFVLYRAGLVNPDVNMISDNYVNWGDPRTGRWVTLYATANQPNQVGHVFMHIAGLWFDTAHWGATVPAGDGPRWSADPRPTAGYSVRHPPGL